MAYKKLFIWVEGPDDERFVSEIIKPILEKKYNLVQVRKYACSKREKVRNFLRSISVMGDCIFLTDINRAPCVTKKKTDIARKFKNTNKDKIVVVIKEIESWYLAGLNEATSKKLKVSPPDTTNDVTKEQFNKLIPKRFESRIDFMVESLKYFSIKTAKTKNKSFKYFVTKYKLESPRGAIKRG